MSVKMNRENSLMKETPIVEMNSISKRFGGIVALDRVNFVVSNGEIHALVGENGAGKSTLMNILNGSIQPDEGDIFLSGQKVEIKNPYIAQKLGISMVHQELKLFPELTVAENIFFGRQSKNFFVNWRNLFSKAESILSQLGAKLKSSEKVKNLSVAQMQQVEIAKALFRKCNLLIMDEPTASLTPEEVNSLFVILEKLSEDGVSIVYISHRLEEVFRISDRITVLRDGHAVGTLHTSGTDKDEVIKLMLGSEKKLHSVDRKKRTSFGGKGELLRVNRLNLKGKFRDISFHLSEGEILGIAGLMGSGRTELLLALFGFLPISSGEIYVRGKKYYPRSPGSAVEIGFALVPENRKEQGLILGMSVKDNILFAEFRNFCKFGFLDQSREKRTAESMINRLNIKVDSILQKVKTLSGGNQQKVVVGKWVLADADILLLDEPTRGIDVRAKEEVINIIQDLVAEGKAAIVVSSELSEITRISDRILVLYNGEIVKELPGGTDIKTVTKYVTGGKVYE
ncbi:MAG: sugar ABC transporter ATP-binding protein [Actinobacteria bacterium]|nr:sugar ABC transporter ATP-binding protein [Actinomycetota bacterium]